MRDRLDAGELIRYIIGGGSGAMSAYLVYRIGIFFGATAFCAYGFGFVAGTVVSFTIQKKWTFRSQGSWKTEGAKYFLLYLFSGWIGAWINEFILQWKCSLSAAFIFSAAISAIINFLGQKLFVFANIGKEPGTLKEAEDRKEFGVSDKNPRRGDNSVPSQWKEYFPSHDENRMHNEGDVKAARSYFFSGENKTLYSLLEQRFSWMNEYIPKQAEMVVELGCGAGFSREFIRHSKFRLTDVLENEWVDEYVDALNLPYENESVDVFVCSHMIHHLASPITFFNDLRTKLKTGGRIIIQDIYTCLMMKAALRVMRHEGYSDIVDVFDPNAICNDPSDPWSANCSIPKLLFADVERFMRATGLQVLYRELNECLLFFLSGGVIAKTYHPPLGSFGIRCVKTIDRTLISWFPGKFACGISVVLEKA